MKFHVAALVSASQLLTTPSRAEDAAPPTTPPPASPAPAPVPAPAADGKKPAENGEKKPLKKKNHKKMPPEGGSAVPGSNEPGK